MRTLITSLLVLISFFLVSCKGSLKQTQTYCYEQTDEDGNVSEKTIEADTDSAAYAEAIEMFAISCAVDKKVRALNPSDYTEQGKPLKFSLRNELGEIVKRPDCITDEFELKISSECYKEVLGSLTETNQSASTISNGSDTADSLKIVSLKKYFNQKEDEFSDVIWVEPKTKPRYTNQNGYCMYFALKNGIATNPRFLIQYEADEWLFIKYMIFNIDGENITFTPEKMETDCGHGGRIWEWCDESAVYHESLIAKIAYAKNVKIKMVGSQYHKVKTMSSKQIEYFKYSYEYYKALGGAFY